jgi:hypothetical protein
MKRREDSMRSFRLILPLVLLTIAAPAFGCEKCLSPGTVDPVGNPITYYKCWNDAAGAYSSCVSGTATERCVTSTDSTCPSSGGGGKGLPGLEPAALPPVTTLATCNIDLDGTCRAKPDAFAISLD